IENTNVAIEYRWAECQYEPMPALAADFVKQAVAVMAAGEGAPVFVARAATTKIRMAFLSGYDPLDVALHSSLNRPDGSLTGVAPRTSRDLPLARICTRR